ncbi:hypothetical protein [Streptomyces massasporeus]|uniref:hypothetical protein n=1 Tax=Streptomyces massasporeus TaxID=67324 RepID=UPI0036667D9E
MIRQSTRLLALACVVLSALFVATVAGVLSWLAEASAPQALLCAGGTFAGWSVLCASLISAFGLLES